MPSVGTAYVNVRVNTAGFEKSLDSLLKKLSTKMEKAGSDAGKSFDRGFQGSTKDTFKSLETDAAKAATKVTSELDKVGVAGKRMGADVASGSRDAGTGLQGMVDDAGDVHTALDQVDTSAKKASRSLGRAGSAGGRAGGGFRRGSGGIGQFDDALSRLAAHGPQASKVLNRLYNVGALGGTAMAALVGAASAAGQALFAVGANAAAAAPSLAVMANGLLSLAQVGTVVAVSMRSVGAAITAGFKAADASAASVGTSMGSVGKATAAAGRAVRDAKQGLEDAYREAARAAADAARRVVEAEHALAAAQQASAQAQRDLNTARQEGIEQMEDIAFAAEDAGLAEERAGLDLAEAQQRLIEVSELAPDDRARVEAELAFKEADLAMREAVDRREDADKAQRKSVKDGIEGTEAVSDAHDNLADAQQNQADAAQDLADAQRDQARTAEDNARRIADAQQAVADATRGLADAQKSGAAAASAAATAQDAYARALEKLSPSQREFVERIVGMRDEFEQFSRDVGEPLFARLLTAMDTVNQKGKDNKSVMDIVTAGLEGTSRALGNTAIKASELASQDLFQENLRGAMNANNQAMEHFGSAGVNLADAFVAIADAAGPLFLKFSKWVEAVTAGWAETARAENKTGELGDTLARAGKRVEDFWGFIKELWRWLTLVGGAADKAANRFGALDDQTGKPKGYLASLTDSLKTFDDSLDDKGSRKKMIEDFDQALKNLNATGGAFETAVVEPLLSLGRDKEVETTMDKISQSDAFQRLADNATTAAPLLADVALNLLDIIAALSESDSVSWFLRTLKLITAGVKFIVDNPIVGAFLGAAGIIYGIRRALLLTKAVARTLFAPAAQSLENIRRKAGKIKVGTTGGVGAAPSTVAGAGKEAKEGTWEAEVLVHLKLIITAIETCCATLARTMAAGAGGELLGAAPRTGGAAGGVGLLGAGAIMPAGETAKVGKFAGVMGRFGKVLGPATKLMKPLSFGIRALGAAFRFALGPIGLIVLTLLPILWPLLVKLEQKTGIFSKTLEILTDVFGWLWDIIKKVFNWVKDNWPLLLAILTGPIGIAVGLIVKYWDQIWDGIKVVFNWFKNNWKLLLAIITGPIGLAVFLVIKYWDQILDFVKAVPGKVKGFLSSMWDSIVERLQWAWDVVQAIWGSIVDWIKDRPETFRNNLRALWDMFKDGLRIAWDRVKEIWNRVVDWIKGRPKQFVANLRALWDIFKTALSKAWTAVKSIWTRITTWVKGRPAQFRTNLAALWDVFKDKLKDAWEWVKGKWEDIKTTISGWPGAIKDSLSGIWNGIGEGLVKAINWVGDKVDWLVEKLNGVTGSFGGPQISFDWPTLTWTGYAGGGPVHGPGGPTSDMVPARLSDGEHVLTAAEVKAMGGHNRVTAFRKSALRGEVPRGGLGDLLGSVVGTVGGAIGKGAEYAIKWVLDKFSGLLDDSYMGKLVRSFMEHSVDNMVGWGAKKDEELAKAVSYPIPSGISTYNYPGHNPSSALDMGAGVGTAVKAMMGGRVISVINKGSSSYGLYMVLEHADGWKTLYAHLSSTKVGSGASVKSGDLIAYSGASGGVSGPHLHLEVTKFPGRAYSDTHAELVKRKLNYPYAYRAAKGGIFGPSPMGTLAVLAEAGKSERVTPLDSEGFTPAERRILESLESQFTGGGDTYHVHPSQKMNESQLADMVVRRVAWKRRRGGGFR